MGRVLYFLAFASLVCLPQAFAEDKLSPPWWLRVNEIEAALKSDPKLKILRKVDDTDTKIRITVGVPCAPNNCMRDVNATQKAIALATLLAPYGNVDYGAGSVAIRVKLGAREIEPKPLPDTPITATAMVKHALRDNKLFVGVVQDEELNRYYVLIKAKVVQYWADDLWQFEGMESEVAASLLGRVYSLYLPFLNGDILAAATEVCDGDVCP